MSVDRATAALTISTAALVPAIYAAALPTLADTRARADDRGHVAAAERYAALIAGSVVLGVAGVTRSPEVAVVGLVAVVAWAAAYDVARRVEP